MKKLTFALVAMVLLAPTSFAGHDRIPANSTNNEEHHYWDHDLRKQIQPVAQLDGDFDRHSELRMNKGSSY